MKTPLIIANWKMGVPLSRAATLARTIATSTTPQERAHLVVCPSSPALALVHEAAPSLSLGAQDCSSFSSGAHTGDVSARDLRSLGCRSVIAGHSERRGEYAETNALIAQKIDQCVAAKLTPILCVGESKFERDQTKTESVIKEQLSSIKGRSGRVMVAYEPLWAIGAKEPESTTIISQVHAHIRSVLMRWGMNNVILLYGGAVDHRSIATICGLPNVDGVLVGRASWTASSLRTLLRSLKS